VASAFRAFSRLLGLGRTQHVVIDTAPTGHTLLLLDVTGAFHCHVMRDTTVAPLMRLQSPSFSRDVLITLAETTPVAKPPPGLRSRWTRFFTDFSSPAGIRQIPTEAFTPVPMTTSRSRSERILQPRT
jgi:anion-transporting  ArsA/GET3 family ATPase